jgi:hypothetical protein
MTDRPSASPSADFLCSLTAKEIREGKPIMRPMPHRDLPFGARFEQLVMTWNFLNSFGSVLVPIATHLASSSLSR